MMDNYIWAKDPENEIFHFSLEQIISVRLPFGDIDLLKRLLNTERLGGRFYDRDDQGGYLFLFDNSIKKPYPSVMTWKYKIEDDRRLIVDMGKDDLRIINYVAPNYLY